MEKNEVFLDPSIIFDKGSLQKLSRVLELKDFHFVTSKEFSPSALDSASSSEFAGMQRRFGGWLGESRRVSKEIIRIKTQNLPISYFSVADETLPQPPEFFDGDLLERAYLRGWEERVDIDELWFLATHSTVLARLKKREQDLALTLLRLLREGRSTAHLTVQQAPRGEQRDLLTLAQAGRWLVWIVAGAAAVGLVPPVVPWAVTGPLILSFRI